MQDIYFDGVAVRPSGNANGIENVNPRFLADPTFYDAVLNARFGGTVWCHYYLRLLVKKPDDYFIGKSWYMPDFVDIKRHFIKQSEIYSLYVKLDEASEYNSYYDKFVHLLNRPGINLLPDREDNSDTITQDVCRFFVYDERYFPNRSSYNGPDLGANSMWRQGAWLRRDLSPNIVFGGAIAYAEGVANMGVVYKFKAPETRKNKFTRLADKEHDTSVTIGGDYGNVAKVFSSKYLPIEVPIVAPVFDQVSLIPSTMHSVRPFSMSIPLVELFIKYLAEYDIDIHNPNPNPPAGTEYMLQALQIMTDPDFRRRGYNVDFPGLEYIDLKLLFGDSYKYPNNKNGAGWLQQACVRYMAKPPPEALKSKNLYYYDAQTAETLNAELRKKYDEAVKNNIQGVVLEQYMVPENNETWIFSGEQYLVLRNGKILDNENDPIAGCGAWYGSGGGSNYGVNTGPSHL